MMYCRIINFTLLAPSLWVMINQFKDEKNDLVIVKLAENKGVIIEQQEKYPPHLNLAYNAELVVIPVLLTGHT